MFKDSTKGQEVKKVAGRLTTGYADHSWCITIDEVQDLGLKAEELKGELLDIVWEIYKTNVELMRLIKEKIEGT